MQELIDKDWKENAMKYAKLLIIAVLSSAGFGLAQANVDSHEVTVIVGEINIINVGGNLTLTIDSGTINGGLASASDTADLRWLTNVDGRKITVASDLVTPTFNLEVEAVTSEGNSLGARVLSSENGTMDLIDGIDRGVGSAVLTYTATATAEDGTGNDPHTVTYTIVEDD